MATQCLRCHASVETEGAALCWKCATTPPAACRWCGAELTAEELARRRTRFPDFPDLPPDAFRSHPWACDRCRGDAQGWE